MSKLPIPATMSLAPSERHYGVIVTCVHDDGPPAWTFHVPGGSGDALRSACAMIDARGPGWRIVSISSPTSVHRDLQGTRDRGTAMNEPSGNADGLTYDDPRGYELMMLRRIGRRDLLAPLSARVA